MRDYANIFTAIWRDPTFRALRASQQRTYFMLITQADISAAGTLSLTVKRWSGLAEDTDRASIEADLKALEAAEYVYVDDDTEELLVRTFVKHDKGYNNPKRRPVILEAARAVESVRLREVLGEELAKLGLPRDLSDPVPASPTDRPSDSHTDDLSDGLSDATPDSPSASERVVVTERGTTPQPSTRSTADRSAPPRTGASAAPPPAPTELSITQRSKRITDTYAQAEPMCKWPAVNGVVIRAIKSGKFTDDEIQAALLRMAAENRSVTVDSLRTELAGLPPRRAPTGDSRPAASYHKPWKPED